MRRLLCLLLLAGCSQSAQQPALSPFQQQVQRVEQESGTLQNLIEMSAPKLDREAQLIVLRSAVAAMRPTSEAEKEQVEAGKQMVLGLQIYASLLSLSAHSEADGRREETAAKLAACMKQLDVTKAELKGPAAP